jgi:CBS domain-containing protein
MQVKEVMTRGVECVPPDCTLQEAAQKMKALDVGPLPICDNDRLAGMLTDRDITVRAVAEGLDPRTTRVRDVMTPEVVWCFDDQDVEEAARLMKEKQIRRLLVLNRDKRLVGIVSLGDLAVETGDEQLAGETLEKVSEPAKLPGVPVGRP